MPSRDFELRDLKRHLANPPASVFEPHCKGSQVAIKVVLLSVRLKKFGLSEEIIMRLHFVLYVYIVLILHKLLLLRNVVMLVQ